MPVKPLPPPETRPRARAETALDDALMHLSGASNAAKGRLRADTPANAAALADSVARAVSDAQIAIAAYRRVAGAPVVSPTFRAGDHVLHAPTGETWVVAWADPATGDLAWCGWPNGIARISDCRLVKAASDAEHQQKLRDLKAAGGSRATKALRLYGEPTPERVEGH